MKSCFGAVHCFSLVAAVLFFTSTSFARGTRAWTYQELYDEADLVLMCTASAPVCTENTDNFRRKYLQQLESNLDVHAVLKGTMNEKTITLVHFRFRDDIELFPGNGPTFVVLETKPHPDTKDPRRKPLYLLFLRSRTDRKYEFVSGNRDPVVSAMRLSPDFHPSMKRQIGRIVDTYRYRNNPKIIPPWERWEFKYSVKSVSDYAALLDQFKIELGAVERKSPIIEYARNLSSAKPFCRKGSRDEELRYFVLSADGDPMYALMQSLLNKAGVNTSNRLLAHFYSHEVFADLLAIEKQSLGKREEAEVRKTVFEVRKAGDKYEFHVLSHEFLSATPTPR